MKKTLLFLSFLLLVLFVPIKTNAESYGTCEYSTDNLGVETFKLKFNIDKHSTSYYLSIDKKSSRAKYTNGKIANFETLMGVNYIVFYKNFDTNSSSSNWHLIDSPKCPEVVRYVQINKKLYIILGSEQQLNAATITVGGNTYDMHSQGAQTALELKVIQERKNNEETINKSKQNLNDKFTLFEETKQAFLDNGCYDKATYKYTTKKTNEGVSYIVWDNSEKVSECEKKLQTLSGLTANLKSDVDDFKNTFPYEDSTEYENKYNSYKKDYDNYKTFVDSKGKDKNEDESTNEDSEYNPGDKIPNDCNVIPPEIRKWINNILNFVKYVALILVIALGALDFVQAAGTGEPDAMKKAGQKFVKRLIAVVVLFLVPVIVDFILNMVNIYGVDLNDPSCTNFNSN